MRTVVGVTHLTARDRLTWLLRTIADAHDEYDPTPPASCPHGYGDPANCRKCIRTHILPGRWHYYHELDTWLRTMRTCTCPGRPAGSPFAHKPTCTRPLHWHLNERYIRPHARTMLKTHHGKVTIEKSGRVRGLPPHTELAAPNLVVKGDIVIVARWHPATSTRAIDAGLTWLLDRMHGGNTDRICLPPDLLDATPEKATKKSGHTAHETQARHARKERIAA